MTVEAPLGSETPSDSGRPARPRDTHVLLAAGVVLTLAVVALAALSNPWAAALAVPAGALTFLAGRRQRSAVAGPAPPIHDDGTDITGLPSRLQFVTDAQQLIHAGTGHPAVLVVEIDRFRDVQTVLGDDRAATVLREVGARIAEVAEAWPVGALGDERFGVAMMARPFLPAHHLGRSLREAVSRPMTVDGIELRLASSVGMALGEGGAESLLRRAAIAANAAGGEKDGLEVHRLEEPDTVRRRLAVASALTDAMEQPDLHDFRPDYQPIVDPAGALVGVEALARWSDPQLGEILPDEFIPLAEQTGLVSPLFSIVLGRSLAACARWRRAGLTSPVSVNVSPLNLRQPLLVSELTAALEVAGLAPEDVILEVTETAVIMDADAARRTLVELRNVGFRVALDDFGVGQSSLARLRELPVTSLKLDKSFVAPLPGDSRTMAIVQATIQVCRALELDIVAEGVDRQAQADVLTAMGLHKLQGFLFSPAVGVDALIASQANPEQTRRVM
ncbi:MAG TPA: bifunctional diguanylate cyclase/phosphodiesterase [Euzebya sp.]|nr:bifunctional diguanylate cyclase/phosphodiesterase [Euzebya sp.]